MIIGYQQNVMKKCAGVCADLYFGLNASCDVLITMLVFAKKQLL